MSAIIPFQFEKLEVRVVTDDSGEPKIVAKDVAEALGYVWNGSAAISHVPEEWKGVSSVLTPGGTQEMSVLTEQGLYFFLGRSDKPKALPFQKWIAGEVIPSIRKTGSYSTGPKRSTGAASNPSLNAFRQARAIQIATSVASGICDRFPNLGQPAQQVIYAKLVNPVVGQEVIPLPILENITLNATEAGQKLGVSANTIGRLATRHNLKTAEYGMWVLDKSRSSDKQVQTFQYNGAGIARLTELLNKPVQAAQPTEKGQQCALKI